MEPPFECDPAKDAANRLKHGLSMSSFAGFDHPPLIRVDDRNDYGETRYRAFGKIGGMNCALVFTQRDGVTRLISLRRAHRKEIERHDR